MGNDVIEKTNSRIWEILEKKFFGLFLFSVPLQTRLTFVTHETYLRTFFNEYATFFLYLSDILFIITFLLYFVNRNFALLTKRVNFSKILNRLSTFPLFIPLSALFLLIAWGFLSISWSEYKEISFYKSLKLAEFGLLFFYITHRLRWFGFKNLLGVVFITGVFQSIVGILQYLYQHSLGLKILGESVLGPNLAGVAKIVVDGEKIIRAYATFPHPNVFAGFLILSIFSGFWLLFTSKIEKSAFLWISILTAGTILQLAAFTLTFSRVAWLVTAFLVLFFGFRLLKNLYLRQRLNYGFHPPTLVQRLFHACPPKLRHFLEKLFNLKQNSVNVSRETFYNVAKEGETTLAFFRLNKPKVISFIIIFIAFVSFLALNWGAVVSRTIGVGQNYQQAIGYRLLYNDIAINTIKQNPLVGIGNGNFTLKMADYSSEKLSWWQYQPAHNIYLLTTSELGIIGLILFLIFIFSIIKMAYLKGKSAIVSCETMTFSALNKEKSFVVSNASEDTHETILASTKEGETFLPNYLMFSIFVGFLFIGLLDHYFWTLQQGQLTLWLVLGVLTASAEIGTAE